MKVGKDKGFLLVVVAFLVFLGIVPVREAKANSYGYRMPITINSSQVQNGPLTNFPFLFSSTSSNLKTTGNGGHVTNANGYDIIFRALDATTCGAAWDGVSCTLSHEIEQYDGTNGTFIAWVKVPSINNGTVIYIYYGNSSVTSSQENKTDVWGTDYGGVWHLGETSNPYNDSTSNGNNSVSGTYPTQANGKIGNGQTFSGGEEIIITPTSSIELSTDGAVSVWFNPSDVTSGYHDLLEKGGNGGYVYFLGATGTAWPGMWWGPQSTSPSYWATTNPSQPLAVGNWYKLDGVSSGGYNTLYINGSLVGTSSGAFSFSNTGSLRIGNGVDGYTQGTIDEIRVSTTVRSADWITTEYNNQSAPSGFYALGTELANPPTLITLASFNVSPQGVIAWQTKSEVDNLGFNLYRTNPDGTGAVRLNGALIPGLLSSAMGKEYTYTDTGVTGGTTVCYVLEDIDLQGVNTYHGPVCTYQPASQGQNPAQTAYGASVQDTTGGRSSGSGAGSAASQGAQGALPQSTGSVTAIKLKSLTAQQGPEGALIEWQTGYEVRNLGFNVYREEGGTHIKLNKGLLAGSALLAGTHTVLRAGNTYSWFDAAGGTYWVEDVDLSGKKTLHGPIVPVPAQGALAKKKILVLSELGSQPVVTVSPFKVLRMLTGAGADFPGGSISALETQWVLAGTNALKLLVSQEGMYRVSFAQLAQAGFTVRRPNSLQLYVYGKEQPILVTATGIEFYATGVDTPWTATQSYWLVNGVFPGKRIGQASGGMGRPGPVTFPATVISKPRSFYFPALLNGEASNWFGPLITQDQASVALTVSHAAPDAATLDVFLQGVTAQGHTVSVFLNGSLLGNVVFDGQTQGHALFSVAPHQLIEGVNQVSFVSSGDEDISAVDTIRLTYTHTYTADGDRLRFTAAGGTVLTLAGFTQPVRIFDITDPSLVQQVAGQLQRDGTVQLAAPGKGTRTLFAATESALQAPQLLANTPSAWHANHRADLVIITHGDFTGSLAPLVSLRQRQGLSVAVVDIEDLYDEFSFGEKTPDAVKMFLAAAKSWARPPRYVLLMGNATYDPRNYTNLGNFDFVPTKLIDTAMIETASDDWFVDFANDGLPDIPIGRIPATTLTEASQAVAKLIAYEQRAPSTRAVYVADTNDATDDFEGAIEHMQTLTSLTPDVLFASNFGGQTAPMLLADLARGAGLVTYLGHGSVQLWDNNVLDTTSARALTNTRFPLFIALTCLNGYFIIPTIDSLATTLLTDTAGGAVGVIASSSLTEFAPQKQLGDALLGNLFTGATVGEALIQAKRAISDPDVQKSYLLFGDPSMRVRR